IDAERGFKRTDFTAKLTAIKGLTLDSYNYDASNATDHLNKSLFKHSLLWNPGKGYSVSFLSEGNSNEKEGKAQDSREHDLFQLDRQWKTGMKLNLFHDTLATICAGKDQPTVTTDFLHFESNRAKPIN